MHSLDLALQQLVTGALSTGLVASFQRERMAFSAVRSMTDPTGETKPSKPDRIIVRNSIKVVIDRKGF